MSPCTPRCSTRRPARACWVVLTLVVCVPCIAQISEPADAPATEEQQQRSEEESADAGKTDSGDVTGIEISDEEPWTGTGGRFEPDSIEPEPFTLEWSRFLEAFRGHGRYSLFDGKMKFRIGMKFQVDGTTGFEDEQIREDFGQVNPQVDLRRFRLFAEGRLRKMAVMLSFDFGADAGLKDAYLEGTEGGLALWGKLLGKFRYGHFQEPFSLTRQTGSTNFGFLEWGLPVAAFAPGRNVGAMVHDAAKSRRLTWAFGAFSFGQKGDDNAGTSTFSLTGRMTGLPVYRKGGRRLFHLGASFSSRNPSSGKLQYRARPEARSAPYLVDTGSFDAQGNNLIGLEAAAVVDQVWAQAEWIQSRVDSQSLGDPVLSGWYAKAGCYLAGLKHRPYSRTKGAWGRVRPARNFRGGNPFKASNGGAWELVVRFSTVDLNGGAIHGGKLTDISTGVNWHLNSVHRVMFNYINSNVEDSGRVNIFLLRYQYAIE